MNTNNIKTIIEKTWDESIIDTLQEYVRIPCKSPMFDPQWEKHGYIDQAIKLMTQWCYQQNVKDMHLTVHRLPGRTPVICIEIPGQSEQTVLLYGHMDKQPEMIGWSEDLGPWQPVIKGTRLYGRGAGDDGYAIFSALTAIKALQEQNVPHARCIILIEASEESGSPDLPFYVEHLQAQLREPSLIICLDSGCGNYEQLWCTTSLRGLISGVLTVEILKEGIHSGVGSGVVPSSFRIIRQLLSRIEDEKTGKILLTDLFVDIPPERVEQAKLVAKSLGHNMWADYPFLAGAKPVAGTDDELVLNRTWRPALSITGVADIPSLESAGNVLRPKTSLMLSMRIPPTCNADQASQTLKKALEADPPYGAKVNFRLDKNGAGWNAPTMPDWLLKAVDNASQNTFNKSALYWGEGGSIPFMGMLGKKFPQAQFVITGVLGPQSNAHGPNEFIDIEYAKKLTCCVSYVLADHFNNL